VISVAGARHNDGLPPAIEEQLHSAFAELF
jgi:hypothetical protein